MLPPPLDRWTERQRERGKEREMRWMNGRRDGKMNGQTKRQMNEREVKEGMNS